MDGQGPRLSSARSLALVNLRAAIEARLTDPALDAGTVAAAAGVSVRYANEVLARNDTSIMRLVQARRLDARLVPAAMKRKAPPMQAGLLVSRSPRREARQKTDAAAELGE